VKPFKPPQAIVTNWLIGLCAAVEAAMLIGGSTFGDRVLFGFGLVPARVVAAAAGTADLWGAGSTLISHIFLHAGLLHLGLNLFFLAWVGRYVEWVAGWRALLLLFLAGGIGGGIAEVLANPASPYPVVGASGAIAAIFGAYAMVFAQSRPAGMRLLGLAISGDTLLALRYAISWTALQLLTGLVFNGGSMGTIAIWTHIGGFLIGLVAARLWIRGPRLF
jgi:membrane associated rhomboid family serine protease